MFSSIQLQLAGDFFGVFDWTCDKHPNILGNRSLKLAVKGGRTKHLNPPPNISYYLLGI